MSDWMPFLLVFGGLIVVVATVGRIHIACDRIRDMHREMFRKELQ